MSVDTEVATHQVALSFEDGVTRFITCRADQTVADASYRQRINIPLDCRDGACGTCKALCESGEYDAGTYIDDALPADEAERGYVLPCSMRPRSDLVLQVASTSEVAKTRAATYDARVTELTRLSTTTVELAVEIPDRGELAFLPGQYVNIAVPGTDVTRSYSFSSAPHEERLSFLVKLTPGGAMSTWLTERARVGDALSLTGPHGSFFLRDTERPVLLLAGGTGLAPVLSMLRKMRADASTRKAHLVYGVSTDEDLVALDQIADVAAGLPGLTWDHCVSDPASTAANKGYVMGLIRPEHLHDGDVAIYLCGPPPMVEAVRTHVADAGIEPTGFYYEKFAPAVPEATSPAAAAPVAPAEAGADPEDELIIARDARGIAGRTVFVAQTAASSGPGEYEIGEEHPDVQSSDALFEAREALELGALELTIGRLGSQQLTGYRLLAEATLPYVDGDRFVDAASYTETNAAFHDYLFVQTGNEHLLQAYQALGVKGRMGEVLRNATWCHPRCASDHVEIVEAFEAGDREVARQLIVAHADRSKQTMRRAMSEAAAATRPRFVTPGRFTGKVVVVTGAAQGIGAQVARRIAAEGGALVLADRSGLVAELAGELAGQGASVVPVTCDLEAWTGASELAEAARQRFGRVDVLVNNVGGAINFKPFTEFTADEIAAELDRSLMTTLLTCRAVLPGMVERHSGVIVNVSSAATRGIHRIPYSAAKGGINAITASLALEYADRGIRVVATAPGGTEAPPRRISRGTPEPRTAEERAWFQAHIDQTLDSSLMGRYGTLDEQAAAITFLASDEATYITGTVLPVAGGDLG
ncbi:benzoate 1,2-dioxygenase electron transfer component BenC [Nocardioides kongjuensis]|uniref:Benzoate/toluate 1,2-dioxygenase reductase subunit n=1 Tax=Nocardioides kongjuensis TaxID=349522 RepID=A0A852RIZ1_9ACTN|nr:benzoate 1,2-dioxygenase electron transfer component BenC [Nocardioides kongjuensis]NYD33447.1 benzoate/toluate 1,2-dioxygenase reductase subunit [Nocardioides kongjuensis]